MERRNGFFETSFVPGRTFASPADFNAQLTNWLRIANTWVVRTIKARPVDLVDADRAAMLAGDSSWRGAIGHLIVVPDSRHRLEAEEDVAVC